MLPRQSNGTRRRPTRDTTERIQAHRLATKDKDTEAYEEMQRQKARNATRMRLQRQEDLQRREEERQRELEVLRGRTLVARALDEKLDALRLSEPGRRLRGLTDPVRRLCKR